jgi:transposase-like protein
VEKTLDADMLREMIGFTAQRLMKLEVDAATDAECCEQSVERLAQCNGYRERNWETRTGTLELRIPGCVRVVTFQRSPSRGDWPRRVSAKRGPSDAEAGRLI